MPSEIPFIRPTFPGPAELTADIGEIIENNWFTNFGPKERQFARALAAYLGPDLHVATLANGTLALLAALHATVGHGAQDRYVLMPSFTFIAVPQAAVWLGYRPWFIDIDPDTWQPSAESARTVLERSRDRIAGIVSANALGVGNPDIGQWEDLAAEWDLPLVVDSAAGFGSSYDDGSRVGGRGTCEIFSFHATKPFSIGEGGALASRDPRIVECTNTFQNFGFGESWGAAGARQSMGLGINAKLQEINAAIGLRQLVTLDDRLASRRRALQHYRSALEPLGLRFHPNSETSSVFCASVCCESTEQRDAVVKILREDAIQPRDYYNPPLHRQPYFAANNEWVGTADLTVTEDVCSRIVSLPVHDHMAPDDAARVVAAVRRATRNG